MPPHQPMALPERNGIEDGAHHDESDVGNEYDRAAPIEADQKRMRV